jgi:hypothetical protein
VGGFESHLLAVALLFQKWFQTASCAGVRPGDAADDNEDARRKLRPEEPRRFIPGQHLHRHRRLSDTEAEEDEEAESDEISEEEAAAIEDEIAQEPDIWSSSGVEIMSVSDFSGIFLLWGVTATCMLVVAAYQHSKKQRNKLAAVAKAKMREVTRGRVQPKRTITGVLGLSSERV